MSSYEFGGAPGDRIVCTNQAINAANGVANLIYGWWYPTTLTLDNAYWGHTSHVAGGMRVDTVTDEIKLSSSFATTSPVWTTTDADVMVDNWWFVAVCFVEQNSAGFDVAGWIGTPDTPPRLLSWTVTTAAAGNPSGSAGDFRIGQDSTNTHSWEGRIASVGLMRTNVTASSTLNPMGLSSYGTINAAEETVLYERFVKHAWAGEYWRLAKYGTSATSNNFQLWHNELGVQPSSGTNGHTPMQEGVGTATINPLNVVRAGTPPFWSGVAGPRPLHGPSDLTPRRH